MSKRVEHNENASPDEECPLCYESLTIKNAVNPTCGHTHCSTCFWKWARKSNACPFCRTALIARDRKKELELENLIERRCEIRLDLEDMYNEGHVREEFLRALQEDIALEEIHLNDLKNLKKENFKILQKIEKWDSRIRLWECCPNKAIELWKEEAKEMKKSWRVAQLKKLRICLDELDMIVCLNGHPYKCENQIYTHKCQIPCLKQLINRVHHLGRAEKSRRVQPEPIKEDFNLDTLFLEPEDLEETEQLTANQAAPDLETHFLGRLEGLQNNPIRITIGPTSAIYQRELDVLNAQLGGFATDSPFHYTSVWTMTDIFEEHRNNIIHHPIPQSN